MKTPYKKVTIYLLLAVFLFSSLYFYYQYQTFKATEYEAYRMQFAKAAGGINSAYTSALGLSNEWESLSNGEKILRLGHIKAFLQEAEVSFELFGPHLNMETGNGYMDAVVFSQLISQYDYIISAWQSAVLEDKDLAEVQEKLKVFVKDFELLTRSLDYEKLSKYDYGRLKAYWEELVSELQLKEAVESYRNVVGK